MAESPIGLELVFTLWFLDSVGILQGADTRHCRICRPLDILQEAATLQESARSRHSARICKKQTLCKKRAESPPDPVVTCRYARNTKWCKQKTSMALTMALRPSCFPPVVARETGRWVTGVLPRPRKPSDLQSRNCRQISLSELTLKSRKEGSTATEFAVCMSMPNIRWFDGHRLDELVRS
jgi:hypothetical protein